MDVAEEKLHFIKLVMTTRRRLTNYYSLNNNTINKITVQFCLVYVKTNLFTIQKKYHYCDSKIN